MDVSGKQSKGGQGRALSPEELRKLIEQGAEIKPSQGDGSADGDGMYLTQLTGKQLSELEQMREQLGEVGTVTGQGRLMIGPRPPGFVLRLRRMGLRAERLSSQLVPAPRNFTDRRRGRFFRENTLVRYAEMLPGVRRNFQRIRPASYRMVRGLEDGEEIDIDRTIEARVARLMGETPDGRFYKARKKEARDSSPRCSCSICRPRPTSPSIASRASIPTMTTLTTG